MSEARANVARNKVLASVGGALLLIALVAAYSNHFHNSFHFDDAHTIVTNAAIRELRNIPVFFRDAATFSSLPSNQSYRPLVSTLLAIDYSLGHGLQPFLSLYTFVEGLCVEFSGALVGLTRNACTGLIAQTISRHYSEILVAVKSLVGARNYGKNPFAFAWGCIELVGPSGIELARHDNGWWARRVSVVTEFFGGNCIIGNINAKGLH